MKKIFTTLVLLLLILTSTNVFATRDIKISLNGQEIKTDVKPFLENDRTLVPIRFISESLGYNVTWSEERQEVEIKNNEKTINLTINSKNAYINNNKKVLDVAPKIKESRTFVPVRFVAENLGVLVDWDSQTYTVILTQNREEDNTDSYLKELNQINKEFNNELKTIRNYFFEKSSNYNREILVEKIGNFNFNINLIEDKVNNIVIPKNYENSHRLLKESIRLAKEMVSNYKAALIEGDPDIAKKVVDLQTKLSIALNEYKEALNKESQGQDYAPSSDVKNYYESNPDSNLLEDPVLKNLFNKI